MSKIVEQLVAAGLMEKPEPGTGAAGAAEGADGAGSGGNEGGGDGSGAGGGAAAGAAAGAEGSDVSNEKMIEWYNKQFGTNIKSVDEMHKAKDETPTLSEEELQKAKEQRQSSVYAYGLQNNLVTSQDLADYAIHSSKTKDELGLALYKGELIEDLKERKIPKEDWPSETEMEQDFAVLYHQYEGASPANKAKGAKMIEKIAEDWLQENYGHIRNLEKNFDEHELSVTDRKAYNEVVEQARNLVPKELTFKVGKEEYTFKVTEDRLKAAAALYSSDDQFSQFRSKKVKADAFVKTIQEYIVREEFQQILNEVAGSHHTRMAGKKRQNRLNTDQEIPIAGSQGGGQASSGGAITAMLQRVNGNTSKAAS